MDLLLENGEIKRGPTGKPISVSGLEELKQRIYIRLKARLGAFIYDRRLGSNICELSDNASDKEILSVVRCSLPELFDAELLHAGLEGSNLTAEFRSRFGDFSVSVPIKVEEE